MLVLQSLLPIGQLLVLFYFFAIKKTNNLMHTTLLFSAIIMLSSTILLVAVNYNDAVFCQTQVTIFTSNTWHISWTLGIDGMNIWFIVITNLITYLTILYIMFNTQNDQGLQCGLIIWAQFCVLNFFMSTNLFFLYFFFEAILIPMFLIIGVYGSRARRVEGAYQFFLYTFIGSFTMLGAIIYIYTATGHTDLETLFIYNFSIKEQLVLWAMFFFSFAVKIPLWPFHIWLPEAHVEAPTAGSVFLAAVVLKMGGLGIFKILLPLFPYACVTTQYFVFTVCSLSMLYAATTTITQFDIKKAIAYSSIVHMSFAILGLFSFSDTAVTSSIFAMFNHGLISGGLFFAVGCLYDRYQSRNLYEYNNIFIATPRLSFVLLFFFLANMGFPGTPNFIAELGIVLGVLFISPLLSIVCCFCIILTTCYNFWLATRSLFGTPRVDTIIGSAVDLLPYEQYILYTLVGLTLLFGLYPMTILESFEDTTLLVMNIMDSKLSK